MQAKKKTYNRIMTERSDGEKYFRERDCGTFTVKKERDGLELQRPDSMERM